MQRDYTLRFLTIWQCVLFGTPVGAFFNDFEQLTADSVEWHQRDARVAIRNDQVPSNIGCERPNIYLCEEPPDLIQSQTMKTCNYRNTRYLEQIYKWVAGRGCLLYTPDFLYDAGYNSINLTAACLYDGMFAPCVEIAKEDGTCGCYPYDPSFEEVANLVRQAIVPAAHGRWERCFYTATDCCSHHMYGNATDENHCEATFDGWTCWHEVEANTIANEICSEFAYSNTGPSCHHYSSKECFGNGTWLQQTDYSTCSIAPRLLRRYRFHIAVLSFSIASCLPAVFIFFFYKRLRVTRVALHRNLLIAIIVRNILVIISRSEIYIDELSNSGDTAMSTHSVACRVLAITEKSAANFVFVAMLVEGIYLHRMIVAVFRTKLNVRWLYGIGVVIALIPVAVWSTVMGVHNDHSCWIVYTVDNVQWALDAPRIAILLINTGLFLDVLRVLLTKLRNSENASQLSTTKVTLFLLPIFGTQFLLTALRPSTTDCTGEQIYYYASYTLEGLQGFTVALLYCYINKEVHALIKQTYLKTENAVVSRVRNDSSNPRTSMGQSDRRLTCSTALPSHEEDNKNQYASIQPRLHVAEIISIQASERLADILEPVYETIRNGVVNEGYDSLERSDNDSGFIPNRGSKVDDNYGFTNASSISIDCQDWIRCVSPSSSVYNNSLNDYEVRYLERKFANHPKLQEINEVREKKTDIDTNAEDTIPENDDDHTNVVSVLETTPSSSVHNSLNDYEASNLERKFANYSKLQEINEVRENITDEGSNEEDIIPVNSDDHAEVGPDLETVADSEIDSEMLDEILQYIENQENKDVVLNPVLLCPNRGENDKIFFVDDNV